ncbi:MAG: GDSL-type esterase/lipase family protein, partial [Acidimicrobiales bacterium]
GYANDLLARERARWPGLQLVEVGCPGETAIAAVLGGGPCTYPTGSQLLTAVQFLQAHRSATVLVTVDLGFNDVRRCLDRRSIDPRCVPRALAGVRRVLPGALARLRAAGGRRMRIVGLEHPDPYVARFLGGRRGRHFATASLGVFRRLNRTLGAVYRHAGAPVANVPGVYGTASRRLTTLAGHGAVPVGVARDCRFTWECPPGPFAGNLHPNARGYRAIARAVASAVGGVTPVTGRTAR